MENRRSLTFIKRMLVRLMVTALFVICFNYDSSAQDLELESEIRAFMDQYAETSHFSGTILVEKNSMPIFNEAYGFADRTWNIPNKPDTRIRIASITKAFTAVLIMKLYEEKLLDIDEPVSSYLDNYPSHEERDDIPTIRHFMQFRSGLPHYNGLDKIGVDWINYRTYPMSPDSLANLISKIELEFEPGEDVYYSSLGYLLLGSIIEKVTGESYAKNLLKYIIKPHGLTNTLYYSDTERVGSKLAKGYQYKWEKFDDGEILVGFKEQPYRDNAITYSTGGIYSTVADLRTFGMKFIRGEIVKPKTMNEMLKPIDGIGLGWRVFDESIWEVDYPLSLVTMAGLDDGHASRLSIIDEGEIVIVILGNSGRSTNTSYLSRSILQILKNKSIYFPRYNAAEKIGETIIDKGLEEGISFFKEVRKDKNKTKYYTSENAFNTAGLRFMRNLDMLPEAIQIFKWNVELFPESINVYDSLAEAYMIYGDKDNAIKNYEVTLEKLQSEEELDNDWIDHVNNQLSRLKASN